MNRNSSISNTIAYASYWIGIFFVLGSYVSGWLSFPQFILHNSYTIYIGLFFLFIKVSLSSFSQSKTADSLLILLLVISAAGTYFASGNSILIFIFLLIIASKGISFSSITKFIAFFLLVFYITSLFFLINNSTPITYDYESNYSGHVDVYRYKLGFGHPNSASLVYSFIIIFFVASYKEKFHPLLFLICLVEGLIIYKLTESRGGFTTLLALSVLYSFSFTPLKKFLLKFHIFYVVDFMIPALMFVLSIISNGENVFTSDSHSFMRNFDARLISLMQHFNRTNTGVTPFGEKYWLSDYLDCSFYTMLILYGVIGLITFTLLYIRVIYKSRNDYFINICITSTLVCYIFESVNNYMILFLPLLYTFASADNCDQTYTPEKKYTPFLHGIFLTSMYSLIVLITWNMNHDLSILDDSYTWTGDLCHIVCNIALFILLYCLIAFIIQIHKPINTRSKKKKRKRRTKQVRKTNLIQKMDDEFEEPEDPIEPKDPDDLLFLTLDK